MKTILFHSKTWLIAGLLVLVLCISLVGTVQAVEIDRDGRLPAGETVDDDLVLTGSSVTVDGTVNGTLIAAGRTITLNGLVKSDAILAAQTVIIGEKAVIEGNLFVAGADIELRGKVEGSLFGGSATLTMSDKSMVGRNIYYGGYQFESQPGSSVVKDIHAAGYQHIVSGNCRNLTLAGVAVELNGNVNGNATVYLGEVDNDYQSYRPMVSGWQVPAALPAGLRIDQNARIAGKLTYTSSVDQSQGIHSAAAGGMVYNTPVPHKVDRGSLPDYNWRPTYSFGAGFWLWGLLRNLASILVLGALVFWLAPRLFQRLLDQVKAHSLGSIGIGFLAVVLSFVVFPFAVLVIGLVGLLFGVTTLFDLSGIAIGVGFTTLAALSVVFTVVLFWAGKLLVSYIIGKWVLGKLLPNSANGRLWPFVTGAVIFALLASIPVFGLLFSFVVALAGLGAFWYAWRNRAAAAG